MLQCSFTIHRNTLNPLWNAKPLYVPGSWLNHPGGYRQSSSKNRQGSFRKVAIYKALCIIFFHIQSQGTTVYGCIISFCSIKCQERKDEKLKNAGSSLLVLIFFYSYLRSDHPNRRHESWSIWYIYLETYSRHVPEAVRLVHHRPGILLVWPIDAVYLECQRNVKE